MKNYKKPLALFIVILMVIGSAELGSFAEAVEKEEVLKEDITLQPGGSIIGRYS
ncbi:MAG: hypothetical protein GX046_05950 [Tissierellia bacterium]|nr:hypothetical protein [Tissierellia bacterium]